MALELDSWDVDLAPYESSKQTLQDQIISKYKISKFDNDDKHFLPAGCLEDLISPEIIIKELDPDGKRKFESMYAKNKDFREFIEFIHGPANKVFAIAVLSGLGEDLTWVMKNFKENGFNNLCLPVEKTDLTQRNVKPGRPWSIKRSHDFCHEQWKFLAPIFTPENFKVNIQASHILPFTEKGSEKKEGAFGQVVEVKVHPAHYRNLVYNDDGTPAKLAIKEFNIPTNDEQLRRDAEGVWASEVTTLDEISGLSHPNLIQRIAAITKGEQRCLMFLWADGGNLRDFWKNHPNPEMKPELVKEMIEQIRGMAEAIQKLHDWDNSKHYRHGDIKPENILRFPGRDTSQIGTLKISDLGSAQHHNVATRLRQRTGGKAFSTMIYQPPETITRKLKASSRLYDIWSMGCVTLEFMIWLLYGYEVLMEFNTNRQGEYGLTDSFFQAWKGDDEDSKPWFAQVHHVVQYCLSKLSADPECTGDTALARLRDIVETKLLVVELPERTESSVGQENVSITKPDAKRKTHQPFGKHRVNALGFIAALDNILNDAKATDERFWCTEARERNAPSFTNVPKDISSTRSANVHSLLTPEWKPQSEREYPISFADRKKSSSTPSGPGAFLAVPGQSQNWIQNQDRVHELSDDWSYPVDNAFASHLLQDVEASVTWPTGVGPPRLCGKCERMNFWTPRFRIVDTWPELETNMKMCDFCKLRWKVSKHLDRRNYSSVTFERTDSMLRMNDGESPVLSVIRSPELETGIPIQIGLPQLSEVRSKAHFGTLRKWLKECDDTHEKFYCQPSKSTFLPTRLIYVGSKDSSTVRLHETKATESLRYLALSHPWGTKPPYFRTFRKNIEDYKKGIQISDLTKTFRDAVEVTRELGFYYLWIDSICIIQRDETDEGDFEQEAARMESVFSSAYCVLAASSAQGQSDGFLNDREGSHRDFVTFKSRNMPPFWVCDFIDDFNQHVLEGPLNKRGWVLQERVLAHRTIYFTNKQTYWECGEGVRCETLTKMENKLASFLADPNFPDKISNRYTTRGERIIFYEDLYKDYSRLAFSRPEDRPIAIGGLQQRLIHNLKTHGGFGVFDDGQSLLRRSLLWQRGKDETSLRKITFPPKRHMAIPSWSWMAYEGGIDFLDLPLGGVEWQKDEIYSPWAQQARELIRINSEPTANIELSAVARTFNIPGNEASRFLIVYDIPKTEGQQLKCIVMGRRKEDGESEDARYYVLYIALKNNVAAEIYERVGVGYMPGRFIDLHTQKPPKLVKVR